MNIAKISRLSLILIVIASISGCAFGTRRATLAYPPAGEPTRAADEIAANASKHRNTHVLVNTFTDARENKETVGGVRNGFGMRTASVVAENDVAQWVTEAVGKELQANGYTLENSSSAVPVGVQPIQISGSVVNAYCDMYFHYNAYMTVDINAKRDGQVLLSKRYEKEGSEGVVWAATAQSFAESLSLSLSSLLKEFMGDLDQAITSKK